VVEYSLTLQNRGDIPLNGLKIECRYFYMENREWRVHMTTRTKATEAKEEEEQKHISCFLAASLESGSRTNLKTEQFVMESWELPSGYYYKSGDPDLVEAKPDGLWVKVRYEDTDGSMLEKNFCDPKSLSSRVEWVKEEPKTASSKKRKKKK
jgi:hypothetical protein